MVYVIKKRIRNIMLLIPLLRTKMYHLIILGSKAPRKNEIIYIDPKKIKGHLDASLDVWKSLITKTGTEGDAVVSGQWDIENVEYLEFTDLEVYKSCYLHWINGKLWQDTPFYMKYLKLLEQGVPNRFGSLRELNDRYENLDEVFKLVKYSRKMSTKREDLIKISMSRDGRLIWGPDGKHRVSMALCLGLEEIPARIGFIHTEAIELFQEIRYSKIKK